MTNEFGPEGNDPFTYVLVPCECLEHFVLQKKMLNKTSLKLEG